MRDKIQRIEELRSDLLRGGGPEAVEDQRNVGQLTARKRVEKLLDPGTFWEIEMFSKPIETGSAMDKETLLGDGLVSGYGYVNGRPVCIWAQDATVLRGKAGIIHGSKIITLMERALRARIPCVGIFDSEGLRLEDMITSPNNYSYDRLMHVQTMASGVIPQISLIMGPCLGIAAISAQLADFVFMVRDTSYTRISPPDKASVVEDSGSAKSHFRNSGCCDVLADGDEDCLIKARELLSFLPLNNSDRTPDIDTGDDPGREVPELLDIVPVESKKTYDVHEVISSIADGGHFLEIKGGWARNLIVGFARFGGKSVGIIANNPRVMGGCLDVDSADKLARFVRFCDAFNLPLLYLADTPAFLPSIEQERKGIIRHGAKAVFSNSLATTAQIQIYLRKCYGGGNLAMPGNNLGGDFGLAWPTAEILLMHPEGAVAILYGKEIAAAENPEMEFDKKLSAFRNASAIENLWPYFTVQDYISPKDTRLRIIRMLNLLEGKKEVANSKRHDNMPL